MVEAGHGERKSRRRLRNAQRLEELAIRPSRKKDNSTAAQVAGPE